MSDPKNANVLTRDRLEDLRLIATGATRRADGSIYEPDRNRLHWLRDHGYITVSKVPAGSTPQERRASRGVTEKGRKAIATGGRS